MYSAPFQMVELGAAPVFFTPKPKGSPPYPKGVTRGQLIPRPSGAAPPARHHRTTARRAQRAPRGPSPPPPRASPVQAALPAEDDGPGCLSPGRAASPPPPRATSPLLVSDPATSKLRRPQQLVRQTQQQQQQQQGGCAEGGVMRASPSPDAPGEPGGATAQAEEAVEWTPSGFDVLGNCMLRVLGSAEGSLDERWRLLSRLLMQYHAEADARCASDPLVSFFDRALARHGTDSVRSVQQASPAITCAACVVLDQLLLMVRRCFPNLHRLVMDVRGVVLKAVYISPLREAEILPFDNVNDQFEVHEQLERFGGKTYFEATRDLSARLLDDPHVYEAEELVRENQTLCISRIIALWQTEFKKMHLRGWLLHSKHRADLQRRDAREAALREEIRHHQDEVAKRDAAISDLRDEIRGLKNTSELERKLNAAAAAKQQLQAEVTALSHEWKQSEEKVACLAKTVEGCARLLRDLDTALRPKQRLAKHQALVRGIIGLPAQAPEARATAPILADGAVINCRSMSIDISFDAPLSPTRQPTRTTSMARHRSLPPHAAAAAAAAPGTLREAQLVELLNAVIDMTVRDHTTGPAPPAPPDLQSSPRAGGGGGTTPRSTAAEALSALPHPTASTSRARMLGDAAAAGHSSMHQTRLHRLTHVNSVSPLGVPPPLDAALAPAPSPRVAPSSERLSGPLFDSSGNVSCLIEGFTDSKPLYVAYMVLMHAISNTAVAMDDAIHMKQGSMEELECATQVVGLAQRIGIGASILPHQLSAPFSAAHHATFSAFLLARLCGAEAPGSVSQCPTSPRADCDSPSKGCVDFSKGYAAVLDDLVRQGDRIRENLQDHIQLQQTSFAAATLAVNSCLEKMSGVAIKAFNTTDSAALGGFCDPDTVLTAFAVESEASCDEIDFSIAPLGSTGNAAVLRDAPSFGSPSLTPLGSAGNLFVEDKGAMRDVLVGSFALLRSLFAKHAMGEPPRCPVSRMWELIKSCNISKMARKVPPAGSKATLDPAKSEGLPLVLQEYTKDMFIELLGKAGVPEDFAAGSAQWVHILCLVACDVFAEGPSKFLLVHEKLHWLLEKSIFPACDVSDITEFRESVYRTSVQDMLREYSVKLRLIFDHYSGTKTRLQFSQFVVFIVDCGAVMGTDLRSARKGTEQLSGAVCCNVFTAVRDGVNISGGGNSLNFTGFQEVLCGMALHSNAARPYTDMARTLRRFLEVRVLAYLRQKLPQLDRLQQRPRLRSRVGVTDTVRQTDGRARRSICLPVSEALHRHSTLVMTTHAAPGNTEGLSVDPQRMQRASSTNLRLSRGVSFM